MKITTRRAFLKDSMASGLALAWSAAAPAAESAPRPGKGPNDIIRLGIIGLGATEAIGGVGGRGHQLIGRLRQIPGVQIASLCDVDTAFLDREARTFKDRGEKISTHTDIRRALEDNTIDAVVVATPNHWHALATIWACQAGKDVYVEKPFSHSIWEGRQMVAAARKYGRIVQVGTQNRSSTLLQRTFEDLRKGELGKIRFARAVVYRPRDGIGNVTAPTQPPASVDYDLWCGPAPKSPLGRKQLHYEWHWFWETGNGEMGNNGIHVIDICRWALGETHAPPRVMSIGGRFGFDDCGQTPNTHLALLDYPAAPILCEIRNLRTKNGIGTYRGRTGGIFIDCENGYFAGDANGGASFDASGKKIKDISDDGSSKDLEARHLTNFLDAVRSRNADTLAADGSVGHHSAAGCHMANISHRIGKQATPEAIRESIRSSHELSDAFERCKEYLAGAGIDLEKDLATMGPWVNLQPNGKRFKGDFADQANRLMKGSSRAPFIVPDLENVYL